MLDTFDPAALLAEKYRGERPGLELVAVEDVAVPVSWVTVDVLAQERKRLPLLDEFVLRGIKEGLTTNDDIAQILGLDVSLIEKTVADQMARNLVTRRVVGLGQWKLALTAEGLGAATDLASVTPRSLSLGYAFDRLVWSANAFKRSTLLGNDEVRRRGFRSLRSRQGEVHIDDVPPSVLNSLIDDRATDAPRVEILAVKRVVMKSRLYLAAALLSYVDMRTGEVQLAVAIDGELSVPHELELNRLGGASGIGITVSTDLSDTPRLNVPTNTKYMGSDEVELHRSTIAKYQLAQLENLPIDDRISEAATNADAVLLSAKLRDLGRFEFPQVLQAAIESSAHRLVVESRCIKAAVVDSSFLTQLERLLRKDVDVKIITDGVSVSDQDPLSSLRVLEARYPTLLSLTEHPLDQRFTLVSDGKLVVGNVSWLSYRGVHDRAYTLPVGVQTTIQSVVDDEVLRLESATSSR